jgi:hypothetical protein
MLLRIAGIIALIACVSATGAAQFPADVQPGTRVRVWLPESYRQADGPTGRQLLRGTIASVSSEALQVTVPGTTGQLSVPRADIRRLEISRGRPSRGASAFERAVGGAIGGAALWAILNDPRRTGGPHYRTDWRAAGVGAEWGAGTGAVLGFIWPSERWRRVRLNR